MGNGAVAKYQDLRVVSKMTLVPASLVIAAVLLTIAAMNYFQTDQEKLTRLEGRVDHLEDNMEKIDSRLATQTRMLNRIDKNLAVVTEKVGGSVSDSD